CLPPRRQPRSTLFPYTTLFRSDPVANANIVTESSVGVLCNGKRFAGEQRLVGLKVHDIVKSDIRGDNISSLEFDNITGDDISARSEEHTSELQSRENLVCRLLL